MLFVMKPAIHFTINGEVYNLSVATKKTDVKVRFPSVDGSTVIARSQYASSSNYQPHFRVHPLKEK